MTGDATWNSEPVRPGPGIWRERFAHDRGRRYWSIGTQDLIRRMKAAPAVEQRAELKNYIYWMDVTLARRPEIDPDLTAKFTWEFARIAKVLGASGDSGVIAAMDQAIELLSSVGKPTTRLHIAKAACCGSVVNEHSERRTALEKGLQSTKRGTARWADAMLEISEYCTTVSHYDRALQVIAELREHLPPKLLAKRYECGASVCEAYAKIASMRDLAGGEQDLERALAFESDADHDESMAMWVSMAHYRKGRVAQIRRNHAHALSHYTKSKEVREKWVRDPRTFAFIHLRIAESLIASRLIAEAEEHLRLSRDLFDACSDRGSGWSQYCLAQADFEIASGRLEAGVETLRNTSLHARKIGFHRGELLSLARLVVLHARRFEIRPMSSAVYGLIRTGLYGELRRNGFRRLFRQLPTLIKVLSMRSASQGTRNSSRNGEPR